MRTELFVITHDHVFDPTLDLKSRAMTLTDKDKATFPIRFRLYDDDGELYYEGRAKNDDGIELAHDWGAYDAGVTQSKYFDSEGRLQWFIG